jgi:hypothetical protein
MFLLDTFNEPLEHGREVTIKVDARYYVICTVI